jgi:hypothetical protein
VWNIGHIVRRRPLYVTTDMRSMVALPNPGDFSYIDFDHLWQTLKGSYLSAQLMLSCAYPNRHLHLCPTHELTPSRGTCWQSVYISSYMLTGNGTKLCQVDPQLENALAGR